MDGRKERRKKGEEKREEKKRMSRTRRGAAAGGSVGCPVLAAGLSKNGAVGHTQPINTTLVDIYPDPGGNIVKDHVLQIY